MSKEWRFIEEEDQEHLGILEFEVDGEDHYFEVMDTDNYLVFGGFTNNCFLQSGFLEKEEDESVDEALRELLEDLECFYRDKSHNRIVCNERM